MPLLLLKNCNLVSLKDDCIQKCDLVVVGDKIFKIIPNSPETKRTRNIRINKFLDFETFDLKGLYITPGFTDSHTHLLAHGIELQRIDLSGCRSPDECIEKLKSQRERDIIFGVNWDESWWIKGNRDSLNRKRLDIVSKDKPVIMRRVCGHFAVCNTKALDFISNNWKIVDRNNGWLYEDAALYLNKIFKPTPQMYEMGLLMAMDKALSMGITSIHEITDINGFRVYQSLKKRLKLRVALYLTDNLQIIANAGISTDFGDDYLKFIGKKIFMDGSIGARTAALRSSYQDSKTRGKILVSEKDLLNMVKTAESSSIQLMIHSIGDRATDLVLKVFELAKIGKNPLRHRLEHLEILNPRQIEKIAQLKLIASMQPNFLRWQYPGNMYEKRVGARYKYMNCFKKIKESGIRLVFGSDCMPLGPFYGINLAVKFPGIETKLTPAEAIQLYTESPPFATFDEEKKGRIEEEKFADFCVLNKNPLIGENLKEIKILKVFVAGKPVYQSKSI